MDNLKKATPSEARKSDQTGSRDGFISLKVTNNFIFGSST